MTRPFAALLSALALAPALSAAPALPPQPPEIPPGPPPSLAFAQASGDQITVTVPVTRMVPVTRQTVEEVNGIKRVVQVTSSQLVIETRRQVIDPKTTGAYGVDGKEIDREKLPQLLKDRTVVVVSTDGQKVSPAYLRALKEGTIVLVPLLKPPPVPAQLPANPPVRLPPNAK